MQSTQASLVEPVVKTKKRSGFVGFLILVVVATVTYSQSQKIVDWIRLRDYQPPAAIAAIADQTTMTPAGRHLFYLNRAELQDKSTFRHSCPNYEATIVIGCYREGQRGIFVLKVDDPRLAGVEQVTSAHEMLHAAYNRLSKSERQATDSQLQTFASGQLSDARIKATLKGYEKTEPGQQTTEMFAIFGTEVSTLPPVLEQTYSRYFSNRQAVVAFANSYQAAFTSRQDQVKQYDARLNTMDASIKASTQRLDSQRAALEQASNKLRAYRQAGDLTSYNAAVSGYNQQVNAYNSLLDQTRTLIKQYNQLVRERNALAAETNTLRDAIDSNALPAQQQ